MQGNSFGTGLLAGLKAGGIGAGSGALTGGLSFGIKASLKGKHFFTGKDPYYNAELKNFRPQSEINPNYCKEVSLAEIEELNGGTRDQAYFYEEGKSYMTSYYAEHGADPSLTQYYKNFGFDVEYRNSLSYIDIGNEILNGNPTVADLNTGYYKYNALEGQFTDEWVNRGHSVVITRVRQWTPTSRVNVWYADPAYGIQKVKWNNFNFNGWYFFKLH
jgi:hypothetical protein